MSEELYQLHEYYSDTLAWDCPNCGKYQDEFPEPEYNKKCVSCNALVMHNIYVDEGYYYRLVPTLKDIEYMKMMPQKFTVLDIDMAQQIWKEALLNQDNLFVQKDNK